MTLKEIYSKITPAMKWGIKWTVPGILVFWAMLYILVPVSLLLVNHFADGWRAFAAQYFGRIHDGEIFLPVSDYFKWLADYFVREPKHTSWYSFFAWKILLIPTVLFIGYEIYLYIKNPYRIKGQALTDKKLTRAIEKAGLFDGKFLPLGVFSNVQKLKMPDMRGVMCMGAPRSGKTTGLVIPSILEMTDSSMIIHDTDGFLWKETAHARSNVSNVYPLSFSQPADDKIPPSVYWNPIDTANMPQGFIRRRAYLGAMAEVLLPPAAEETPAFWINAAREVLPALVEFFHEKITRAAANDYFVMRLKSGTFNFEDGEVLASYYRLMPEGDAKARAVEKLQERDLSVKNYIPVGSWEGIAKKDQGIPASLPFLVKYLEAQYQKARQKSKKKMPADAVIPSAFKPVLKEMILESLSFGYGLAFFPALVQTYDYSDKQCADLMTLIHSALSVFKDKAISKILSANDITYPQILGLDTLQNQTSIYLLGGKNDKNARIMTSLFLTLMLVWLEEDNLPLLPHPVCFMLDDFQEITPASGFETFFNLDRDKNIMTFVCINSWQKIVEKYGYDTAQHMLQSDMVKIIKRLDDTQLFDSLKEQLPKTGEGESILKSMHRTYKQSAHQGILSRLVKTAKAGWNTFIEKDQLSQQSVFSMAIDKHLILFSKEFDRLIRAETPLGYLRDTYGKFTKKQMIKKD
ncbi:MAG: type IV secretory system conjugative DNA transfer family protein [Lactobacillales bacterium]|jgi:hypothetical protein|nr:type IV secretory system conjugative DNA transfer family protein [Lactobacillales bacterium]